MATKKGQKKDQENRSNFFDGTSWFIAFLWAFLFAFVFRSFLFEPFKVPTASMVPNLLIGDRVVVSKYSYGYNKHSLSFSPIDFLFDINGKLISFEGVFFKKIPERGDVVVFKDSHDNNKWYVKRLIGMPLDKIQMKMGSLHINGKMILKNCNKVMQLNDDNQGYRQYKECREETHKAEKEYRAIYSNSPLEKFSRTNNTQEYIVPADHYFFMGDNRDNSRDSRVLSDIGYVHHDYLVGKVMFRFWDQNTTSLDFSRLFNGMD